MNPICYIYIHRLYINFCICHLVTQNGVIICCELTYTERRVKRDTASDLCILAIFAWKLPNIPTTSLSRFIANSNGDHLSTGT